MKTVWILGSGFSKSLGGPLLNDLLTERGRLEIVSRLPKLSSQWGKAHKVFQENLRSDGQRTGGRLWAHAEEFLDIVDAAAENPNSAVAAVLRQALKISSMESLSFTDFRQMAILSVAAECCFAQFSDPQLEAWQPYVTWASKLDASNTIATFNYDTVLETLGDVPNRAVQNLGTRTVVRPWDTTWQCPHGGVEILKLHGSVSWSSKGDPTSSSGRDDTLGLDDAFEKGFTPLIGTPGPRKNRFRHQHFDRVWNHTTFALERAETVVFLGYRFPPSDSRARTDLLHALKSNRSAKHLKIHTVLGPNTSHPDTVRLTTMLDVVLKDSGRERVSSRNASAQQSYQLVTQPLYVEDFLSVLNHDFLHG